MFNILSLFGIFILLKTPCDVVWYPAAVAGAELGKKEFVESRNPELDLALKKQRIPSAETLPSDTRKSLSEISLLRPLTVMYCV